MKKINDEKLNKGAVFTLVVMVLFMSIISIELIVVIYSEKINTSALRVREKTTTTKRIYKDNGEKFTKIDVNNEMTFIKNKCSKGCNLTTNEIGKEYKYIIEKVDNNYLLSIVDGEKYVLYLKNIGESLDNAYFINYLNYVVFGTVVENEYFEFDYAVVLDNQGAKDEFESLNRDEMLLTNEGIVYYYDECINGGTKVQARRYPFVNDPVVIGSEEVGFDWCN